MPDFHLIPLTHSLYVAGVAEEGDIGEFSGVVLAIGVRGTEPVIAAEPKPTDPAAEGLLGWGSTHLLVADESKPAPVWVTKNQVTMHSLSAATVPVANANPNGSSAA